MSARFIDIEGIDQSGKETQTRILVARLRRMGLRVATLSFPVYATPSGRQIRDFLDNKRRYSPEAVHMLYSLNRWENKDAIKEKLETSDFLVADRYSPSNLAYGLARGLSLSWLSTLDKGLPRPNVVILLDVPVRASFSRKLDRRDIHESNKLFLRRVRKAYLKLARKHRWRVVNGSQPTGKVAEEVWERIGALILRTKL